MYGADPQRTQAQTSISVRPPFRVVWSRGLGTLIEFPAVVQDGVAYIANAQGTVRALDMRNGDDHLAARHAARQDGVVARRLARPARSCTGWTGTSGCCAAPTASCSGTTPSARRSSRRRRDRRRRRRLRRVERDDHRARPADAPVRWRRYGGCKITSSAALAGSTLYIGDYCGRLLALRRAQRRAALVARASTAASTARRQSRPAASSCRARPAAR